jgi:stage II sporulation protein D (peptidoglycan lytic transglycosylase)
VGRFFSPGAVTLVSVLAIAACSGPVLLHPVLRPALAVGAFAAPAQIRVKAVERGTNVVRDVALEDYVEATILSEFAPAAEDLALVEQMLEVQAVISRTYALSHRGRHAREGFDLCPTTHCQLYEPGRLQTSKWAPAADEAVRRTAGLILRYDDAPIEALFHADCGGHTSTATDVWGGENPPYLRAQRDNAGEDAHVTWRFATSESSLQRALNLDPRTRVGTRLRSISVVSRDRAGRAQRVKIGGSVDSIVRGEDLREVLSRTFGPKSIRSTWFDVSQRSKEYVFSGRGYGHGVGLCQAGALARLRSGKSPAAVLQYYFPGTQLVAERPGR